MAKILILEDQADCYQLIKYGVDASHETMWAKSVSEAKQIINDSNVDLAIVDICLPDGDGFEFCSWIRQNTDYNKVPVIFASSNLSVESKITGLMMGGDDYVSKPFHLAEMRARIEAKLRFSKAQITANNIVKSEGISINLKTRQTCIDNNGKSSLVELTSIEFKILHCLIEEPGKLCSRDDILNATWGKDVYVYPRSVDTHVSKLRKKLGDKGKLIKSVHGSGYRLEQTASKDLENETNSTNLKLPTYA